MINRGRKQQKTTVKKKDCRFCNGNKTISYLDADLLSSCLSDRGKILPRFRSVACSFHQRRLVQAIKRARFLAILPFTSQV